jgi:putative two-component system response regulator
MMKVLVVDDEETIRLALRKFLRSRGFEVEIAGTGEAALKLVDEHSFTLMLCDVRMPGMTGVELVPKILAKDPDLAIIMLTAVNDAATATEVLSSGATDYLMKPVELADLQQALDRALTKRSGLLEQRRVEKLIREEVALRTAELEREKESLRLMTVSIAETLINAMEAKDVYLRGHSQRVGKLAGEIAEELALEANTCDEIRLAGRLHDVGKIGIREAVLNKPEALTFDEFEHVKEHVKIGMDILAPLPHIKTSLSYLQHHHEKWGGGGYPAGLRGDQITLGGRILSAADTYDALTSKRAYRDPLLPEVALKHLESEVGQHLDELVYRALEKVVRRRTASEQNPS